MKGIQDFDLEGKRVLIRCDFNVPLDENGFIANDFRIVQLLPTIRYALSKKAKVILMSHLGDPGGTREDELTLEPIQKKLAECLGISIVRTDDCVGKEVEQRAEGLKEGEVLLLENLRFHKEEEENDEAFAKQLAGLGDFFINDAFSACHRAHASIVGITQFLPCGAGLLLQKEVEMLTKFSQNVLRPFVVIVGGAKVKDKLSFVDRISQVADLVLLGNLVSNEAKRQNIAFKNPEKIIGAPDEIPSGFDVGPKTVELFSEKVLSAKSIFWTGPLGEIEKAEYAKGSLAIAEAIKQSKAFSVAGGGNLASFLEQYGLTNAFSYVSTGGGATLEFLSGEKLPGLEALQFNGN